MTRKKLVILSASFRRTKEPEEPISSLERFDGVYFRLVRKYLREGRLKNIDIVIVSDKYGILSSEDKIPYDPPGSNSWNNGLGLDKGSVLKLREQNLAMLKSKMERGNYSEVYVNVGKEFMSLIHGFEELVKSRLIWASGRGLGPKARHMKNWILQS